MRLAWAIVAGLALGAGLGWWLLGREQAPAAPVAAPGPGTAPDTTGPRLYRWRDDAGTLHITDRPPPDRAYEEVEIRSDQNVVPPLSGPAPEPEPEPVPAD